MDENGIKQYITIEEQLKNLKKEQFEAERIYRGRMQMGDLNHDPASIQELTKAILDRKLKIDDLEAQVSQSKSTSTKYENKEQDEQYQSKSDNSEQALTVYNGRNPVLKWIQKIVNKLEQKLQKMDERSKMTPLERNQAMFEKEMEHVKGMQYDEYQRMASMNNVKSQEPKEKTAHQLFVDKISGNGLYHTYGSNAKNMGQIRTMADPEKMKHIENQLKDDNLSR